MNASRRSHQPRSMNGSIPYPLDYQVTLIGLNFPQNWTMDLPEESVSTSIGIKLLDSLLQISRIDPFGLFRMTDVEYRNNPNYRIYSLEEFRMKPKRIPNFSWFWSIVIKLICSAVIIFDCLAVYIELSRCPKGSSSIQADCNAQLSYLESEGWLAVPEFFFLALHVLLVFLVNEGLAQGLIDSSELRMLFNRNVELKRIDTVIANRVQSSLASINVYLNKISMQKHNLKIIGNHFKESSVLLLNLAARNYSFINLLREKRHSIELRSSVYSIRWYEIYRYRAKIFTFLVFSCYSFCLMFSLLIFAYLKSLLQRRYMTCINFGIVLTIVLSWIIVAVGAHAYIGVFLTLALSCTCQAEQWRDLAKLYSTSLERLQQINEDCKSGRASCEDQSRMFLEVDQLALILSIKSFVYLEDIRRCMKVISSTSGGCLIGTFLTIMASYIIESSDSLSFLLFKISIFTVGIIGINIISITVLTVTYQIDTLAKMSCSVAANLAALMQHFNIIDQTFALSMYLRFMRSIDPEYSGLMPQFMGFDITYENLIELNISLLSMAIILFHL